MSAQDATAGRGGPAAQAADTPPAGAAPPGAYPPGPGDGRPRPAGPAAAAGAALATLAVAGTALAGVLLRPSRGLFADSAGPAGNTAVVILVSLGCLAAGLAISARYRRSLGYDQNLPAVEQRLADAVRFTLIGAALLVPLMLLLMHRFPGGSGTPPEQSRRVPPSHIPVDPPPVHDRPPQAPSHGWSFHLPHALVYVLIAALVLTVLLAAYHLWRQLRRGPVPQTAGTYGQAPGDHDLLADAVDSGRRALLDGDDPRAAVIACYAAMEDSLARSGVARRASDSPQDLLERAAGSGLLDGPHATDLTALFREARYSTHPMDTTHRDRAAAALDAIAAQLAWHAARAAAGSEQPAAGGPNPVGGDR